MVLPSMNKSVEAISNNHLQQPNKFPLINGLADVRDYYVANCLLLNLIKAVCELKTNLGSSSNNLRRVYFYWKKIKQSRLV